ncbi:unnamed protein product [Rotaria socialis]
MISASETLWTYSRIAAVFGRFPLMIRPFTTVSSRRNARPGKSVCVYLPSSINLQYVSLNIQYYIFISVMQNVFTSINSNNIYYSSTLIWLVQWRIERLITSYEYLLFFFGF